MWVNQLAKKKKKKTVVVRTWLLSEMIHCIQQLGAILDKQDHTSIASVGLLCAHLTTVKHETQNRTDQAAVLKSKAETGGIVPSLFSIIIYNQSPLMDDLDCLPCSQ